MQFPMLLRNFFIATNLDTLICLNTITLSVTPTNIPFLATSLLQSNLHFPIVAQTAPGDCDQNIDAARTVDKYQSRSQQQLMVI